MLNRRVAIIRNAAAEDFGGGERFPVFLSQALSDQGYDTIILSRSAKLINFAHEQNQKILKSWWWNKQQWSGINNILLPVYLIWQFILYIYYLVVFSKIKPGTVHVQSRDDFIAATYAANTLGINVVWTDHADLKHVWKNVTVPYKNMIGKIVRRAANKTSCITVVSSSEYRLITDNLKPADALRKKIEVIHNGVFDLQSKYAALGKFKDFTFLIASRLVTDKGIAEGIIAFKKLTAKHPNTSLVIIGDGPERDTFTKLAADTPAIRILGHQPDPISFMAKSSAFVHPTYHEGFSVALVEAGMMSLPIIATSVGGNPEIIEDQKTGLLVPAQDSESLYGAMLKLYLDDKLQIELGKSARVQFLDKFQFNSIVKESFIPLYEKEIGE